MKIKTLRFRLSDSAQFDKSLEDFCSSVRVSNLIISNSDSMIVAVVLYGEKDEPIKPTGRNTKAKAGKGKTDGGEAQA